MLPFEVIAISNMHTDVRAEDVMDPSKLKTFPLDDLNALCTHIGLEGISSLAKEDIVNLLGVPTFTQTSIGRPRSPSPSPSNKRQLLTRCLPRNRGTLVLIFETSSSSEVVDLWQSLGSDSAEVRPDWTVSWKHRDAANSCLLGQASINTALRNEFSCDSTGNALRAYI
eukprot:876197-Prorocentrum_minimum.AAC.7